MKMPSISSIALSLLTLSAAGLVSAAPDVRAELLPCGCAAFPAYVASSGNAGPWSVHADGTGEHIDGIGLIAVFSRGQHEIRWGNLAVNDLQGYATNPLRCVGGPAPGSGVQGLVPTGVSSYTWEPMVAADIPYSSLLMYKVEGTPIEPYALYNVDDDERRPGVFLGSGGYATWGFRRQESAEFGVYWETRLLGANSQDPITGEPLFEGEITGFLKVWG
ncbi:hypothetical protein SODALDRAFT_322342 [Sodiomyces alkalinus F11]|uniref:Uncharacterized protein n=1 Tax=Sodiomyces alkalinus (strain CBS 110278 / VKM F-3762 / F11) TaxID=1314773 RepID=A0A3N2Q2Z7_SODAK|nr:hypothetical protein SODALDRAFT_322342 [Sodiomyces alkalinus F11]ROT41144.1 hypothetical protein SODALDRAFT_322342 [Sodiomyces alkalinus F11]